MAAGLRFISGNPIFRPTLTAVATLNFFNYAFQALFVLYATRTLDVAAGTLGLVLGAGAVGGLIGAFAAGENRATRSAWGGPSSSAACSLRFRSFSSRWRTGRGG